LVSVPNLVAFPIFSKIQDDPTRLKSAFFDVTQLQSIIAFPIFLGILIVAPEAVRVLYTDKWAASIPVMQILMLIGIVRSAIYFYSSIFRAAGKPSWRFGIYSLTAVLNVVGFLIVVKMGIVAVAASYVVVSYILMPLYFLMIRKLINVSIRSHLMQYVPALVSSLIMIVVVLVFKYFVGQNFSVTIRLVIFVLAGGAAYLLSIRLIRPSLYTKMLELAKMVLPRFMARQD
jgi:PST family polysaccharide transporter